MTERLAWKGFALIAAAILGLAALTLGTGLGRSGRLSYHEAFVAQSAREMLASDQILIPTLGGRPWLEKPPLAIWLVALTGRITGGITEFEARLPSAIAAALLALGVTTLGTRRFGSNVGLLAGLVQATTSWTILRGRLAEADMLLACLVTWTFVAYDHLRTSESPEPVQNRWRWAFFMGLGLTALAKGIGFGAILILVVVAADLLANLDRDGLRRLRYAPGWIATAIIALAWPLLTALRHPSALGLWFSHVSDRLADNPEQFAGAHPWWHYGPPMLGQLLPWTPLALLGAFRSLPRTLNPDGRGGADRFLWAWAIAPVALLSLATVKNAHYAIHALPPWSIWSALGLIRVGERLQSARGWTLRGVRIGAAGTFATLGLVYAIGFAGLGPWFNQRGRSVEWAFYEAAGRALEPGEPVSLLYNVPDWDRAPYVTPFGPVPHDWGIRLFYLEHPAPCVFGVDDIAKNAPRATSFAVIGRESDLPALETLGRVETVAIGPTLRASASKVDDRTYRLYRIIPPSAVAVGPDGAQRK